MSTETGRSILIVEDEAMIAMMLEEYLGALGHHVQGVASTLEEALDKVARGGFDLAILDIYLNGTEIWPVAEKLDEVGLPFILSSGGALSEIPAAFAARPMLAKPYTMGIIAEIIDSVLK
ncbi:MAG: response regulator [Sphingobium sp.]|nr:response regulator [Sphingobium sp.]